MKERDGGEDGRQIIVQSERVLTFFCLITVRVEMGTDLIARER